MGVGHDLVEHDGGRIRAGDVVGETCTVARFESGLVVYDQHIFAGGEAGHVAAGKGKGDPFGKGQVGQVEMVIAGIKQFDILVVTAAKEVVHQFGRAQVIEDGILERRRSFKLDGRRPVAPSAGVVLHATADTVSMAGLDLTRRYYYVVLELRYLFTFPDGSNLVYFWRR